MEQILSSFYRFKKNNTSSYPDFPSNQNHQEFEIRFSTFFRNEIFNKKKATSTTPKDYRFVPVVAKMDFYRLLNIFSSFTSIKQETNYSIDYIYGNNIKKTSINGFTTIQKKERIKDYTFFPLNMRFSLSSEMVLDKMPEAVGQVIMTREKFRQSFFDKNIRYDFTRIKSSKGPMEPKESFEIDRL